MKNKKLKEFIANLQAMAMELDETNINENIVSENREEENLSVCTSNENTSDGIENDSVVTHSDLASKFFKVTTTDGRVLDDRFINAETSQDRYGIGEEQSYFDVEVNYSGFLSANGLTPNTVESCLLDLIGTTKMYHGTFYVISKANNKKYGPFNAYNSQYYVDLKKLYNETGSANFRFIIGEDWIGDESFKYGISEIQLSHGPVVGLQIINSPDKLEYYPSEFFDTTGLLVKATCFDGTSYETDKVEFNPKNAFTSKDKRVEIWIEYGTEHIDISVLGVEKLEVLVPPKKVVYFEGDEFEKNGMIVNCLYCDGENEEITDYTITPATFAANDDKVILTYKDGSAEIPVQVISLNDSLKASNEDKNVKEVELTDKACGYLDLNSGKLTTIFNSFNSEDFVIPLNISHLHSEGFGSNGYGNNWRLNLNRTLKKSDSDNGDNTVYTYTTETGESFDLEEFYYRIHNGEKYFVHKEDVKIDLNGNLTTVNGNEVFKMQSGKGYTLIPEIDDFIDSEFIEQKQSEQVELEEYVKSFKKAVLNYWVVSSKNGRLVSIITEFDEETFNELLAELSNNSDKLLLTESEMIQLLSYYTSLEQLNLQDNLLVNQDEEADRTIAAFSEDGDAKKLDRGEETFAKYDDEVQQKLLSYVSAKVNKTSISMQKSQIKNQRADLNYQINFFIKQAHNNLESIKDAFATYLKKQAELKQIKRLTPVNYLRDENGIISGFNEDGFLVCLYNAYGNYVMIEYDSAGRINDIYDSNDKAMDFYYENGLLKSITDNRGRKVEYSYNSDKLVKATFTDGSTVSFTYTGNRISLVESSNALFAIIKTNSNDKVAQIINAPHAKTVSGDDDIIDNTSAAYITSMSVIYEPESTKLSYKDGEEEVYTFYASTTRLKKYEKNDGRGKIEFDAYSYSGNRSNKEITKYTGSNIDVQVIESTVIYNRSDQPVSRKTGITKLSDSLCVSSETEYKYGVDNNLIEEKTTTEFREDTNTTQQISCVKYHYNARGSLILTESYVEGEELKTGKNIEERVYDENGNVIKTIRWNTLDSSTKFYSESDFNENGQTTADKDETGESIAEYVYVDGTNVVNSIRYADGSKFAYGRNPYDYGITSITQSTESGESNTTDVVYNYGLPVKVKSGNTVIAYEYDSFRRKSSVSVNNVKYADFSYRTYNKLSDLYTLAGTDIKLYNGTETITVNSLETGEDDSTYKNGIRETHTLIVNDNVILKKQYNAKKLLTKTYAGGISAKLSNPAYLISYEYDNYDNLVTATANYDGSVQVTTEYAYDTHGSLVQKINKTNGSTESYTYSYTDDSLRRLANIGYGDYNFKPLTDVNGRNIGKEIYYGNKKLAGEYINYRKVGDRATNMPSAVWYAKGSEIKDNIKYTYDKKGNITEVKENGALVARYAYDTLNRLIREDNKKLNKTYLFDYDGNGNITVRRETAFTLKTNIEECEFVTFEYGYNGDRLVSYNGEECEYNGLGSPTKYRGKSATWKYGKVLISFDGTSFTYDGLGRRTGKGNIQFVYDNDGKLIKQSNGLEFIYDHSGVTGFKYDKQYFYRKDVQGNIIAILDSDGNIVVKYIYDAWGNHDVLDENGEKITSATHIGNLNPFRYRGYYYDTETGLYYLQTRYYDPEIGRFISQDSIEYADSETINGLNLYAYCGDNPVMFTDPEGTTKWWEWLLGIVIIVAAVALSVLTAGLAAPLAAAIGGGVLGAIVAGAAVGAIAGAIAGFGISVGVQGITNGFDNINWGQVSSDTKAGSFSGMVSGGIFGGLNYVASASGVASSLTGLTSAQKYFDKAQFILQNTPIKITGGVIATDRITAQLNYNVASVALGTSQSSYNIIKNIAAMLSALAQFGFKLITNNFIKGK